MPDNNQVPDQRLQEMQEQLRRATETVNQLKGTIDTIMTSRQQPRQEPTQIKHNLKPEVAEDVTKIAAHVAQTLGAQQNENFRQAYNGLWERNDMNEFRLVHGVETYDKYKDKIEGLREERRRAGQFMSRDEAYKFVYYDENSKKPKPNPPPPQGTLEPKYDPYLQKYVGPEQTAQPPVNQNVTPPTPPLVTPEGIQPPVQTQEQGLPVLPAEGSMKSTVSTPPPKSGPITFNQDSGAYQKADDLKAFEERYGDIPL